MDPVNFMTALSEATVRHYEDLRNKASNGNATEALLEHNVKLSQGSRLPYHGILNPVPLPSKVVIYEQEGESFRSQEFPFSALPAYQNILEERRRLFHKIGFLEKISSEPGEGISLSSSGSSSGLSSSSSFPFQVSKVAGEHGMAANHYGSQPTPSGPPVPPMGRPDSYTASHQGFVDQTPAARSLSPGFSSLSSSGTASPSAAAPPRSLNPRLSLAYPPQQRIPMQRIVYELPGYGTLETSCYQVVRKGRYLVLVWDRAFPSGVRFSPSNTSGPMLLWVDGAPCVFEVKYSGIEFSLDSKDLVILDIVNTYDYSVPDSGAGVAVPEGGSGSDAGSVAAFAPTTKLSGSAPSAIPPFPSSGAKKPYGPSTDALLSALTASSSSSSVSSQPAYPEVSSGAPLSSDLEEGRDVAHPTPFGVLDSLESEEAKS